MTIFSLQSLHFLHWLRETETSKCWKNKHIAQSHVIAGPKSKNMISTFVIHLQKFCNAAFTACCCSIACWGWLKCQRSVAILYEWSAFIDAPLIQVNASHAGITPLAQEAFLVEKIFFSHFLYCQCCAVLYECWFEGVGGSNFLCTLRPLPFNYWHAPLKKRQLIFASPSNLPSNNQ